MAHVDAFRTLQNTPAPCHRCGWTGIVFTVRRRDRKLLGTGREYGRLCLDCGELLLRSRTAGQDRVPTRSTLRVLPRRDVA